MWAAFFKNFSIRRIKKGIKLKIIYNEDLRNTSVVKMYKGLKLTEVRFLKQITPAGINVHGDNAGIVLWKKKPYAFIITSKEVSNSFREFFNSLWKISKK